MILTPETLAVPEEGCEKNGGFGESIVQLNKEITLKDDDCSATSNENLLDALKAPECVEEGSTSGRESVENIHSKVQDDGMLIDTFVTSPIDNISDSADKVVNMKGLPIIENILETKLPVDTVISCSDGKIGAHRIVLAAISPFLCSLFDDQKLCEVAVLILPDIKKHTMETLLHLAYTGKMVFSPHREQEIYSAVECLRFGERATLDMTIVTLKTPKPNRLEVAGSSRSSNAYYGGQSSFGTTSSGAAKEPVATGNQFSTPLASTNMRKRRLSDSAEGQRSCKKSLKNKKRKFDKDGKQVQVAFRSGAPIGKEGARKLRKKEQKRIVRDGRCIIHPPRLISDPVSHTITLNPRQMPFTSVRLRQLTDFVCIEFHPKTQPEWIARQEETEETKADSTISENINSSQPPTSETDNIDNISDTSNTDKEAVEEDNMPIDFSNNETQIIAPELEHVSDIDNIDNHSLVGETEDTESGFADNEHEMTEALHVLTDGERKPEEKIQEQSSPRSMTCSDSDRMDLNEEKRNAEIESDKTVDVI